jgi:hypothetical protein
MLFIAELDFTGSTCNFFRWNLLYRGSGNFPVAAVYLVSGFLIFLIVIYFGAKFV